MLVPAEEPPIKGRGGAKRGCLETVNHLRDINKSLRCSEIQHAKRPGYFEPEIAGDRSAGSFVDHQEAHFFNDMVAEAQARNINVFHFRVVKDGGDDFYLEGEALADSFATGVTNWLRDILNINQVPFQVSCTPEP